MHFEEHCLSKEAFNMFFKTPCLGKEMTVTDSREVKHG
jgi:hypothetical protein